MMLDRFRLLFDYERWANRRTIESIEAADTPETALRWMAHILAAQEVWLARLREEDSSRIAIWPARDLSGCRSEAARLEGEIRGFLDSIDEGFLGREIVYRNQTGREFRNTPLDILTHLGMHSHYHRGQIAAELRRLGFAPAVTDFIAYRRL